MSLARTDAGRDVLRSELESWFAESYYGRLSVGSVAGSLPKFVILRDVRLYDDQDRLWLQIDTIMARPRWLPLLRRHLEVHSIQVTRPKLYALYQADGTWNFVEALNRRKPREDQWNLQTTRIRISDGRIETGREAMRPSWVQNGWMFDVTASTALEIRLDMEFQSRPNLRLFDIHSLSATLPEQNLSIDHLGMEVLREAGRWHINEMELISRENHLSLVGVQDPGAGTLSLGLQDNLVTPQFAASIFPRVTLPDTVQFSGRVQADRTRLEFDDLLVRSGVSTLVTSGLLDLAASPRSFEFRVLGGSAASQDMAGLFTHDWQAPDIMGITATAHGEISDAELTASTTFDLELASGRVTGSADVIRSDEWSYEASLAGTSVDLGLLDLGSRWHGTVNGQALVQGFGRSPPDLNVRLNLSPSEISGVSVDTLSLRAAVADEQMNMEGFAASNQGYVSLAGELDLRGSLPVYTLSVETRALDLGVMAASSPIRSSLHSNLTVAATGLNWDELSGSITIHADTSTFAWDDNQRTVPPHAWTIQITDPNAAGPRISVGGDVVSLEIQGDLHADELLAVGETWSAALRDALDRRAENTRARSDINAPMPAAPLFLNERTPVDSSAVLAVSRSSLEALDLDCSWQIHKPEILSSLLPMLPVATTSMNGSLSMNATGERIRLIASLDDSLFSMGQLALHGTSITLSMEADLTGPLEETIQIEVEGQAAMLTGIGRSVANPKLTLSQNGRTGAIQATVGHYENTGPGSLTAEFQILEDRDRLMVAESWIVLGGFPWHTSGSTAIDLYTDAVVLLPIVLESPAPTVGNVQRLGISGALSKAPTDTLHVRLDDLALGRLSDILQLRRPLQGDLNAELSWTGLTQTEITGSLHVDTLALDNRVIGRMSANSRLLPNATNLQVTAAIEPLIKAPHGMDYTENALSLNGIVELPTAVNPGTLDLGLDITRADASFLEELLLELDHTTGGFSGQGSIGGTLSDPVVDASLVIDGASFSIPKYNTTYRASASLRVDREGIHVDEFQLSDASGGRAQLSGRLPFNDYRFLSFDIEGNLDALQIINVPTFTRDLAFYGDISVTGDLTLEGPISNVFLRADNLVTTPQSEVFIPIRETAEESDPGFIIYADSSRSITEQIAAIRQRENLLRRRPEGERNFAAGLDMDLNILGPPGSTIRLVIDPLLGDVINGVGSARIQLQRLEDEFLTYGTFDLTSGDYLFTAGEVFVRRFLINEGTITWAGDPLNPILDIRADYRTRASRSGLPENAGGTLKTSLPLIVNLHITGELNAVQVDLGLALDQRQEAISDTPLLEAYLNQPDLAAEHATSVLLTNSFLLSAEGSRGVPLGGSAFNSVSSLVSSQLNRYLSQVIPNADFSLGVQSDETAADLDVSAGIALRLLDERLVIRGQGVYRGLSTQDQQAAAQGLEGEFVVEIRLSPSVAIEVFYRREGDVLSETLITSETGLGVNYRAEFSTWRRLWQRIFGSKGDEATAQNTERAQSN